VISIIVSPVFKLKLLVISAGVSLDIVVPSPSWPCPLYPHVNTLPSDVIAAVLKIPAAIPIIVSPAFKLK